MPLKEQELRNNGVAKRTRLALRDASSGGPAKYDWLITQNYGKDEVKLTHEQMAEIILIVQDWLVNG